MAQGAQGRVACLPQAIQAALIAPMDSEMDASKVPNAVLFASICSLDMESRVVVTL